MTRKKTIRGGQPFNKNNLYYLLRNVVYAGKVCYRGEVYPGEHQGIVDQETFDDVQRLLVKHGQSGGLGPRVSTGGVLAGLVRCHACDCAMTHTYTARGSKRYRYYVCMRAQKQGYDSCPMPSVPAAELERFVVDQIRGIGRDPTLVDATVAETVRRAGDDAHLLEQEAKFVASQVQAAYQELSHVSVQPDSADRMAELQTEIQQHQRRLTAIRQQIDELAASQADPAVVARALTQFDPVWEAMSLPDQNRVLRSLIRQIDFDGPSGEVELTFHPTGFQALVVGDADGRNA
jgi:site-specific DNA recombinase